jgi:hypothetical protein
MHPDTLLTLNDILVKGSGTLEELSLSRCKLRNSHMHNFTFPKGLIKLNLSENHLGDDCVKVIG